MASTQIQWWVSGTKRSDPCTTELIPTTTEAWHRVRELMSRANVVDVCVWWPDHEIEHVVRRIDGKWEHVSRRTHAHAPGEVCHG